MSHGANSVFTASMASGATLTQAFDLQRSWVKNYLVVPSMASNSQFHIQASESSGGTFRRIKVAPAATATVASFPDFYIHSSNTSSMAPIPGGFRYIKVETTATVDGGQLFNVICSDQG